MIGFKNNIYKVMCICTLFFVNTISCVAKESVLNEGSVLAPTITSIALENNVTTLNVGEKVELTVVATYSDGSTSELDTNVEYIIIPVDSVDVNGTVLTAKIDGDVTVQAKVGNTLLNTLNLTIAWVVDGHVLPPDPDPTVNDSMLLGIDVNDNGVRDDVERWIYDRYQNDHPVMIPLRMQLARAYQQIIVDPSKAREMDKFMVDAVNCEWAFTSLSANYFGRKPLTLIESEDSINEDKEMEYVQFNNTQRARAYGLYNQELSGGVYELEYPSEKWIENCDFNTTLYIKMSEKL